ncbi:unannotated protein [freshwater metagenome]|uniref:Unannotated protein n=1 Tax=freshwater metagenome TaxID=449393 RepID=A0A6J7GI81_9ZZZZ
MDTDSGSVLSRSTLSNLSAFANRLPLLSTSRDSPAPAVTTGTTGTPASIAKRANPVRPENIMSLRCRHDFKASTSPPGKTRTLLPSAKASRAVCRPAGLAPNGSISFSACRVHAIWWVSVINSRSIPSSSYAAENANTLRSMTPPNPWLATNSTGVSGTGCATVTSSRL